MPETERSTAPAGEYQERGEYHRHLDRSWRYYPVYVEKMAFVRRYLDRVPRSHRILDLGCGEGLLVEEYRQKGHEIQGVDLNFASEHVTAGSITEIPAADESCDLVLALDVVEHLEFADQERAFAEMRRVLRPGGRALVTVPNLAHLASRVSFLVLGRLLRTSSADRHPGDRPIGEYLRLARAHGFRLRRRKGLFPTFPLVSLLTWAAPGSSVPLHKLLNAVAAPPGLCFLNVLELERQ